STGSSGAAAADAILGRPWGEGALPPRVPVDGPGELEGYYRELLHGPRSRDKWIVCPCEDVLLTEIEDASRRGFRGIEVVKRLTGVGTGLCQGRYCLPDALLLLSEFEGRPPAEVGYITQRPPVFPTPLEALSALPATPDGAGP
ncbi:MAG TPA: (2Fe-2S)-binding protein, partial [Thermoplasmata archaeon]